MSNHLTEEQIDFLTQAINRSNIESLEMKEDLIDHFCCAIEEEMKKGLSFEEAYDKAYHSVCPDGFDEIQRETVFLLTFKKIKAMKRLMYVSGYISALFFTTTIFLKLNHLPFGSITLLITALTLVFVFLPSFFMNMYKRALSTNANEKAKYIFGFLGLAFLVLFILFRIQHWPGTLFLFLAAILSINFGFLPFLFMKMYRKAIE